MLLFALIFIIILVFSRNKKVTHSTGPWSSRRRILNCSDDGVYTEHQEHKENKIFTNEVPRHYLSNDLFFFLSFSLLRPSGDSSCGRDLVTCGRDLIASGRKGRRRTLIGIHTINVDRLARTRRNLSSTLSLRPHSIDIEMAEEPIQPRRQDSTAEGSQPVDPVVRCEMPRDKGGRKGSGGVDGGVGVANGEQVAGEEGEADGEWCHKGGSCALVSCRQVDKAQDRAQPEFKEETADEGLSVVLVGSKVKEI